VGLPVLPDARRQCVLALERLRGALNAVPPEAAYRLALEKMMQERLQLLADESKSDEEVEEAMETQLEELVDEVDDEIALIPLMVEGKPWVTPPDHKGKSACLCLRRVSLFLTPSSEKGSAYGFLLLICAKYQVTIIAEPF
jgi:hypothetical protein